MINMSAFYLVYALMMHSSSPCSRQIQRMLIAFLLCEQQILPVSQLLAQDILTIITAYFLSEHKKKAATTVMHLTEY